ncbi:threonine-phosphate decarboxylase CobD [Halomonas sp. M1]|uniref:threonine-phosphate decarboxylase CobD n=1 Tax=Halomonas sp. M1 TaxID=3035470 RepID=UPI002486A81E|nr:threonine-phosphate decarboxylase CobD [Halomonas sp. M1]WFE71583.1 threonine-phosphate decarboxylase CobD [Halomonas sp. M1]
MSAPNLACTSATWPAHGGQAETLLAHFGLPADHPVEDFSANLNPLGPPPWVRGWLTKQLDGLERYPAPDYATARQAIAAHHQLQPDQVLLTNGGAEAIFLAAALHAGKHAAIVTPSFGEYARACRAHRLTVSDIALRPPHFILELDALMAGLDGIDVLFLCRPNNPTATLIESSVMEALLERTVSMGCHVVVDEAFVDMAGDSPQQASLAPLLARYPHLMLLHSMTKFYTLPGLRLGYLLGSEATIQTAAIHQPPWSVNHLAAELVAPLLADKAFANATSQWLTSERPAMEQALKQLGLDVVPSHACFFCIRPGSKQRRTGITSDALFERLLRHGVLVRHTHNFSGLNGEWLRIALRDAPANQRLISVLRKVLNDCVR